MRLTAAYRPGLLEAGCDEAGRGCLAGPVVAAAVILPADIRLPGLNDSKQLTEARREKLRPVIERGAIAWCVAHATVAEIDRINILNASILAMHRAIDGLGRTPELLLIDGNRFKPYLGIAHACIVGGDGRYRSIAAASVLAKTHRDELMRTLDREHPDYGWAVNKGYPTPDHRRAIRAIGPSAHHRMSFALLPNMG